LSTRKREVQTAKRKRVPTIRRFLDLFGDDGQLNVYPDKLALRPPGAPTTSSLWEPDGVQLH
jgi:hypothetical protein